MSVSELILQEFEKKNFKGFLFLSKGLGTLGILHNFISSYAKFNTLTLIANLKKEDSAFYRTYFEKEHEFDITLHDYKSEKSQNRAKSYLKGGVVFTTSQILTNDLLSGQLSADLVNNMLIFRSENYQSNSTNFMIRLIVQKSRREKPEKMLLVTSNIEKIVDRIHFAFDETHSENALIWPYFRYEIGKNIENQERQLLVEELELEFSNVEIQLQSAVTNLIDFIVKTVKKDFEIDLKKRRFFREFHEDFQLGVLIENFHSSNAFLYKLCEQSDETLLFNYWKLVESLEEKAFNFFNSIIENSGLEKSLESKIFQLEKMNSVEIPQILVEILNKSEKKENQISEKLRICFSQSKKMRGTIALLEKIQREFEDSEIRNANVVILFNSEEKTQLFNQKFLAHFQIDLLDAFLFFCKLQQILNSKNVTKKMNWISQSQSFNIISEILRKYLNEIMPVDLLCAENEFNQNLGFLADDLSQESILIENNFTENGLKPENLNFDPKNVLNQQESENESKKTSGNSQKMQKSILFAEMENFLRKTCVFISDGKEINLPDSNFRDNPFLFSNGRIHEIKQFKNLTIINHSFNYQNTFENKFDMLNKFRPDAIIFYDADQEFMREIVRIEEIYPKKKNNSIEINKPKILYNIFVKNSIQSQKIYEKIFFESKKFEELIEKSASLPKSFAFINSFPRESNKGMIIVDDREFGSKLPFSLYLAGFNLISHRLITGDYILSDNIGVERKDCRTGDLSSSIKTGRLEKQLELMLKTFKKSILLVENYDDSDYTTSVDLFKMISKHRGVSLLYSKNEHQTMKIFSILKKKEFDPNVDKILKLSKKSV